MSSRAEFGLAEGPARKVLWKPIIAVLICALAVATVALAWPRAERGEEEENLPPMAWPEAGEGFEYARYRASLKITYIEGTEYVENVYSNIPYPYYLFENGFISFQDPLYENIEVKVITASIAERKVPVISWLLDNSAVFLGGRWMGGARVEMYFLNIYRGDKIYVEAWIRLAEESLERLTLRNNLDNTLGIIVVDITLRPGRKIGDPGATFWVSGSLELLDKRGYMEHWKFEGARANALESIVLLRPTEARWVKS